MLSKGNEGNCQSPFRDCFLAHPVAVLKFLKWGRDMHHLVQSWTATCATESLVNSAQTGRIVKREAQRSPLSCDFLGGRPNMSLIII